MQSQPEPILFTGATDICQEFFFEKLFSEILMFISKMLYLLLKAITFKVSNLYQF